MSFIKLTDIDEQPYYLNVEQIDCVTRKFYKEKTFTIIRLKVEEKWIYVYDDLDEVMKIVSEETGKKIKHTSYQPVVYEEPKILVFEEEMEINDNINYVE